MKSACWSDPLRDQHVPSISVACWSSSRRRQHDIVLVVSGQFNLMWSCRKHRGIWSIECFGLAKLCLCLRTDFRFRHPNRWGSPFFVVVRADVSDTFANRCDVALTLLQELNTFLDEEMQTCGDFFDLIVCRSTDGKSRSIEEAWRPVIFADGLRAAIVLGYFL